MIVHRTSIGRNIISYGRIVHTSLWTTTRTEQYRRNYMRSITNTANKYFQLTFVTFLVVFRLKTKGYIRPQSDEGHRKLLRSGSHFEAFSANDFERYPPLECKRHRPPNELKHCSGFFYLFINCCFLTVGGQIGRIELCFVSGLKY